MSLVANIRSYALEHSLLGPIMWVASLQYFIVQPIVAWAWAPQYSWTDNVISNLGNTGCQQQLAQAVCSPLAPLMNTSFIVLGLTMLAGAVLLYFQYQKSPVRLAGFSMAALGGIGTVLVGLFPENTNGILHFIGAILALGVANLGLVALSFGLKSEPNWLRLYAFFTGVVGLVALVLFGLGVHEPLGVGTTERLASYPYTMWLIVYGAYLATRTAK